jgi:Txe/YoeB family toxin of Txe-Axe toxin-antitoxin module
MFTPEEHTKIIQEISTNIADQAKVNELLTKLSDDYGSTLGDYEKLKTTNADLDGQNKRLIDYNNQLFLKVGAPAPKNESGQFQTEKPEAVPFESLFDKNGRLKRND